MKVQLLTRLTAIIVLIKYIKLKMPSWSAPLRLLQLQLYKISSFSADYIMGSTGNDPVDVVDNTTRDCFLVQKQLDK